MSVHDYESQAHYGNRLAQSLCEVYSGTDIVGWYGQIERQLGNMLSDAEKGRNWPYADKIRKYLDIWRENEITGSINRETVEILKSGTEVMAVDSWNLDNYFSTLRDQLRKLIASEEELPRDMDMDANNPMAGMGGGGRGAPPMSPSFGPQDEEPGLGGGGLGGGLGEEPGEESGLGPEGAEGPEEEEGLGDTLGGPEEEEDEKKKPRRGL